MLMYNKSLKKQAFNIKNTNIKLPKKTSPSIAASKAQHLSFTADSCCQCEMPHKSIRRDFSPHAWQALVQWNEIAPTVIQRPICGECYDDLREILLERAHEVVVA